MTWLDVHYKKLTVPAMELLPATTTIVLREPPGMDSFAGNAMSGVFFWRLVWKL